jgi:hypothetical protein
MQGTEREYNVLHTLVGMASTYIGFREENGERVKPEEEAAYEKGLKILREFIVVEDKATTLMAEIVNYLTDNTYGRINDAYFFTTQEVCEAVDGEPHQVEYCIQQLIANRKVRTSPNGTYFMFVREV